MAIANGDLLRLSVVWNAGGSDEQANVWHIAVDSIPATLTDLHEDIVEYFVDLYGSVLSQVWNSVTHNRIEVFNQSNPSPEIWIGADSSLNGASGGDPLPLGAAMLLYWRTDVSRVIGKKYLPVFTDNLHTSGVWAGGTLAAGQAMAERFMDVFVGANGTEFRGFIYRKAEDETRQPISANASSIAAYQRRRRPGRGS